MVCLCDPRSMVCNEEDPKSPFNGWLKTNKVAIDFRGDSVRSGGSNQQSRRYNRLGTDATAHSRQRCARHSGIAAETRLWPRFRGRTGAAVPVLWAKVCPLAPFLLVPINTPLGFFSWRYPEFKELLLLVGPRLQSTGFWVLMITKHI